MEMTYMHLCNKQEYLDSFDFELGVCFLEFLSSI